jgi:hypothetical protein
MRVIKNEKKVYLENAKEVHFFPFILLTPSWWGSVPTMLENEICFKRLDTRYDWEARFIWNIHPSEKKHN